MSGSKTVVKKFMFCSFISSFYSSFQFFSFSFSFSFSVLLLFLIFCCCCRFSFYFVYGVRQNATFAFNEHEIMSSSTSPSPHCPPRHPQNSPSSPCKCFILLWSVSLSLPVCLSTAGATPPLPPLPPGWHFA